MPSEAPQKSRAPHLSLLCREVEAVPLGLHHAGVNEGGAEYAIGGATKVQDPSPLIAMPRGEGPSAMHERGGKVGVNPGYPPKL